METSHEFDFAVSYAGPDQAFVTEVVSALKARGLTVFYAPDEQADMIGRNLLDYLHTVYLSKARYCLLFASKHYAERKWTNKVERPAAQERALDQDERYIIPIRLDDTRITGLSGNTLDIRNATPRQIADLCVAVMLRDEEPAAVGGDEGKRDRLILRIKSFTELDTELLRQSFKAFSGWSVSNAGMIPVELRLPNFFMKTMADYEAITQSKEFEQVEPETRKQFTQIITMIRKDLFNQLLRVPSWVLTPSQPDDTACLTLPDHAVELIRRFVLAKFIAAARCLASYQLKGFPGPSWASQFADCERLWVPRLMGGLPWLCRAEGSERHLWLDADIFGWGTGAHFSRIRISLPSAMVIRHPRAKPTADDVLRFVSPQLLERELDSEGPFLLHGAFHYPERMEFTSRNENVIESQHLHELHLHNFNWKEALPAMEALREGILEKHKIGRLSTLDAIMTVHAAESALHHKEVFASASQQLYEELDKEQGMAAGSRPSES